MSVIDDDVLKTHDTEVLLYESHLEGYEGKLFARTMHDKILTYEDVCVWAKERGGFTGRLEDLKDHTVAFLRAMVSLLRDGYGINIGDILEAVLHVSGWFENEYAQADKEKNRVSVRVRTLPGARKVTEGIRVVNRGRAPVQAYVAELIDTDSSTVNELVTKDGIFTILGRYLKIVGDDPKAGVFFVSPGSPDVAVKVTGKLAVNDPSKIMGKAPELLPDKDWYIEIRTYYSGTTGRPLKELRKIRSKFMVHMA
jgi:hypothetical protein